MLANIVIVYIFLYLCLSSVLKTLWADELILKFAPPFPHNSVNKRPAWDLTCHVCSKFTKAQHASDIYPTKAITCHAISLSNGLR